MRKTTRTILRGTVSALLVVGALALSALVAIRGLWDAIYDYGVLSTVDVVIVVVSLGLLGAAYYVAPDRSDWWPLRTSGRVEYGEPEPSRLEELGYRVPPESEATPAPTTTYEDGTVYHLCEECGAKNEFDYNYCRECSAELEH